MKRALRLIGERIREKREKIRLRNNLAWKEDFKSESSQIYSAETKKT